MYDSPGSALARLAMAHIDPLRLAGGNGSKLSAVTLRYSVHITSSHFELPLRRVLPRNRAIWRVREVHWPHLDKGQAKLRWTTTEAPSMNQPGTVIGFVNAAHFIDHYAMLVFAAAVVVMGPVFGMAYSDLLPYATPGFVAFGARSLLTGWLGDRGSRRHMMAIFFLGIGAAMAAVGLVHTPWQLGAALLLVGLFAAIYHPVGTAMLVSYADRLGREVGINGVWGNLGVASSALLTGIVCQYLG